MQIRNSARLERKIALLNADALEELRKVRRLGEYAGMSDIFIANGWFNVDATGNIVLSRYVKWEARESAMEGLRVATKEEGIAPRNIKRKWMERNGFRSAIERFFNGSFHEMVAASFPEENIQPWELEKVPWGFFDDVENRKKATRWLFEVKLLKDPREADKKDFENNGLSSLLYRHDIMGSPWRLVHEAYPEIRPWEMPRMPMDMRLSAEETREMVMMRAKDEGIDPLDLPKRCIPASVIKEHRRVVNVLIFAGIAVTDEDIRYVNTRRSRNSARSRALKAAQRRSSEAATKAA